jgi:hypothetical protein
MIEIKQLRLVATTRLPLNLIVREHHDPSANC